MTRYYPCPECGSYLDDCRCDARDEYRLALRALGMDVEPSYADIARASRVRVENDLAALRRALREYGY
jgi:hypothetical protein